ncbi:hypothetical protein RJ55_06858 [Drechmeria coniospora]|nr:hypothetical protein RJ55_06858 [Drechmeria coniospora]
MESHGVDDAASAQPPADVEAAAALLPPDAPRRCFICLTDEHDSDPPGSWVDPCPCTLEAHQDCMLAWVTDCERSSKPLVCPVCKSTIKLEGPWDPVVAATDAVHRRFTRLSPVVLFTGLSLGVQFSLQMYGAMALWTFAGRDALIRFVLGPDMVVDGRNASNVGFIKERIWSALVMTNVAPTLLFGRLLPSLSNKVFLPVASVYGIYHMMHHDDFLTWPPSPQLAMSVFPYIRSIYWNLWRELVLPYEMSLNGQLVGLPPAEERPDDQVQRGANDQQRQADGGIMTLLQGLLDVLHQDEDVGRGRRRDHVEVGQEDPAFLPGDHDGEIMVELQIGDVAVDEDGAPLDLGLHAIVGPEEDDDGGNGQDGAGGAFDEDRNGQADEELELDGNLDPNLHEDGHEAPPAPPRRIGIGAILSHVSNAIVGALVMPGISFAMGELLRLALPRRWTAAPHGPWSQYGIGQRPALLQQQWGRSLVGGCLYVMLKDAARVYSKSRRVVAMHNRRVKNVDRRRRGR